jgi:hypothetical protein
MKEKSVLNSTIFWKKIPNNESYFYSEKYENFIYLRINNFPEEPLFTLINGLEIWDIEDRPDGWILEN